MVILKKIVYLEKTKRLRNNAIKVENHYLTLILHLKNQMIIIKKMKLMKMKMKMNIMIIKKSTMCKGITLKTIITLTIHVIIIINKALLLTAIQFKIVIVIIQITMFKINVNTLTLSQSLRLLEREKASFMRTQKAWIRSQMKKFKVFLKKKENKFQLRNWFS